MPNSKITHIGVVGEGSNEIEEYNSHDFPPTLRIIFESSFGSDSCIKNEVWLPSEWNGELLGLGSGGYGGKLGSNY